MKIIIGFLILAPFLLIGCKKQNNIDLVAFPSEKLDSYQYEGFDNSWDVETPDSFTVSPEKRTLFSVTSTDESTGENYEISCIYIGDIDSIPNDSIIMYCHGQSLHMDAYWARVTLLANIESKYQYGVLMMDYRGYGMSEGKSDEAGLSEDVDACITWLKEKGANPNKTFFYGFSLGAIPAIERAALRTDFKPNKLIIESPLASVNYLTQSSTIINVDSKFVTNLEFENAELIKKVTVPLLWFHGIEDTYIAIENGELVYNNHGGTKKEAFRIEGADHSEVPRKMGVDAYMKAVQNFLNQ